MHKTVVNFITLGCAKNQVDSERLMMQLELAGCEVLLESEAPADVVILNTCGFIADAKEQSIDTILELLEARAAGHYSKVIVMGCLSQRYPTEMRSELPDVDHYFGVDATSEVLSALGFKTHPGCFHQRMLSTPAHYAYLKISEGCNRKCSFCIIPAIRGRHRSVPVEDLLIEARYLSQLGVKELLLVAQDLSAYGADLDENNTLLKLLQGIEMIDGIAWIRLHYAYPAGFPDNIIPLMASSQKILPYIDIPFQHASDRMLKAMRRGHTADDNLQIIRKLRESVPNIAIRTTLITGFPGETDEDFQLLANFVKETRFDRMGVFTYSEEEGTHAATLPDDVPEEIKAERKAILMEIQENISLEKNQSFVGKTLRVLIDQVEDGVALGRTVYDSPDVDQVVIVQHPQRIKPGIFVDVNIMDAGPFELYALQSL